MGESISLGALSGTHHSSPELTAYLARPGRRGPTPGVVMVHEVFGLDDVLRRQADHLASKGYLVIAPDLFSAGNRLRCLRAAFSAVRSGTGQPFHDLDAARAWLLADDECDGNVGVIGFCMGGGFALLLAGRGYAASAVNYGMLPKDLDAALRDPCPIVASYGGRDKGLKGSADRLEDFLTRRGVEHDVKEYPDAGHAFLNEKENGPWFLRPALRLAGVGPEPKSAADAWGRIERFFAEQLG